MIRHIRFFALIAVGLYFVSTCESSNVDSFVNSEYAMAEGSGIREVEFDTERYDYTREVVEGAHTVLYFYSDSCYGCRLLHSQLPRFLVVRPDVAVRKFNLGARWSGDQAYNTYGLRIGKTPFIHVYDPEGNVIAADVGQKSEGFDFLYKWMNAELKKAWEREHAS